MSELTATAVNFENNMCGDLVSNALMSFMFLLWSSEDRVVLCPLAAAS